MKKAILLAMLSFSLLLAACGEEDDVPEPEPSLLPPSAYSSQTPPTQQSLGPALSTPEYAR